MGFFEALVKGMPDWHLPINRNFEAAQTQLDELSSQMSNKVDWIRSYNPNMVINGNFEEFIINQRGKDIYENESLSAIYCIDRFWNYSSIVTVKDGYINFKSSHAANFKRFSQYLAGSYLAGKSYTATIKFRVKEASGITVFRFADKQGGISNAISKNISNSTINDINTVSITFTCIETVSNPAIEVLTYNTANDYIDIDIFAIKLEEGDHFTGFTPVDYTSEFAKCQRYFMPSLIVGNYLTTSGSGAACYNFISIKGLRVKPSIIGNVIVRRVSTNTVVSDAEVAELRVRSNGLDLKITNISDPVYITIENGGLDAEIY